MYNFPHYLEKIKWELNSLLGFKICIGFLRIVIIGRLFQCCSLARIGSGFFLGFFLCVCERLKTHLSCYHWKHVFLLIHTGVPVSVIYWNAVSAFGMSGIKQISVIAFQVQWPVCWDFKEALRRVFHGDGRISQWLKEEKTTTTKSQSWKQSFSMEETCSFWPILFRNVPICNAVSPLRPCWLYGSSVIPGEVSWATQLRRRGEGREPGCANCASAEALADLWPSASPCLLLACLSPGVSLKKKGI